MIVTVHKDGKGRLSFRRPEWLSASIQIEVPRGSELREVRSFRDAVLFVPTDRVVAQAWFAGDLVKEARRAEGKFRELMPACA